MNYLHDLWNDSQKAKQGCVILLKGFPGVVELTIARAIRDNLPTDTTGLIDGHVLINPAETAVPSCGPAHKVLRQQIRRVAFEALTQGLSSNRSLKVIMTDLPAGNDEDITFLTEHVRVAKDPDVSFCPVGVICDREEHSQRLIAPAHTIGGRTKLRDNSVLQQLLEQHRFVVIRRLPNDLLAAVDVECFTLEITGLTVDQAISRTMWIKHWDIALVASSPFASSLHLSCLLVWHRLGAMTTYLHHTQMISRSATKTMRTLNPAIKQA